MRARGRGESPEPSDLRLHRQRPRRQSPTQRVDQHPEPRPARGRDRTAEEHATAGRGGERVSARRAVNSHRDSGGQSPQRPAGNPPLFRGWKMLRDLINSVSCGLRSPASESKNFPCPGKAVHTLNLESGRLCLSDFSFFGGVPNALWSVVVRTGGSPLGEAALILRPSPTNFRKKGDLERAKDAICQPSASHVPRRISLLSAIGLHSVAKTRMIREGKNII